MSFVNRGKGYPVVRTDKMMGTDVRTYLVSVKYINSSEAEEEIYNGHILKLDGLMADGDSAVMRECYKGVAVEATDPIDEIVLIASPELMYDERLNALDDYVNEAGKICRGYKLHTGDIFSVTKNAFSAGSAAEPAIGDVVELADGTQLQVIAAATGLTSGSTQVGEIIDINTVGQYTYYVIEVA